MAFNKWLLILCLICTCKRYKQWYNKYKEVKTVYVKSAILWDETIKGKTISGEKLSFYERYKRFDAGINNIVLSLGCGFLVPQ